VGGGTGGGCGVGGWISWLRREGIVNARPRKAKGVIRSWQREREQVKVKYVDGKEPPKSGAIARGTNGVVTSPSQVR